MAKRFFFEKKLKQKELLEELSDPNLQEFLSDTYEFEGAFRPEGFDVVFLLKEIDEKNSLNDKWQMLVIRETKISKSATITLDNMDEMQDEETTYTVLQENVGNFKQVIEFSLELIKKRKNKEKIMEEAMSEDA